MPTIDWQTAPYPGRTLYRNITGTGQFNLQHPASVPPEHRGAVKTTQKIGQQRSSASGIYWSRYQFQLTDQNSEGPFPVVVVFSTFGDLMKNNLMNFGTVRGTIAGLARIRNLADGQLVYNITLRDSVTTRAILFNPVNVGDMDLSVLDLKTSEYQIDLFTFASISLNRRQIFPAQSASLTLPNGATGVQVLTL